MDHLDRSPFQDRRQSPRRGLVPLWSYPQVMSVVPLDQFRVTLADGVIQEFGISVGRSVGTTEKTYLDHPVIEGGLAA